jgi:DNA adenine methylase
LKTPLTYYGGKQQLATRIISLIPKHRIYCEPFIGGGAVFFQKEPSTVEIINDTNSELINFYEVVKLDFPSLESLIRISLHSRQLHRQAQTVYNNPDMFDKLKRAWAVWFLANQSFGAKLDGPFGYDRQGSTSKKIEAKREAFTEDMAIRLQNVQIECTDALRIIRSRDTKDAFFYCDPPYVGSDMGHYDGYTQEDFELLLQALAEIEGKFVLSSYKNPALAEVIARNRWSSREIEMHLPMTSSAKRTRRKIEVLTANFEISTAMIDLVKDKKKTG